MTTIVTRSGKGSPLTHTEVDTNFTNLNTAKLEAGAIALGSAATPSISFTGDTNTGIFSPGADQLAISTGGTSRLHITSGGLVGIGSTIPPYRLTVKDTSDQIHITNPTAGDTNSDGFTLGLAGLDAQFINRENGSLIFYQNSNEAFRVDPSKRLLVGTTISPNAGQGQYGIVVAQGYAGSATGEGIVSIQRGIAATSITSGNDIGRLVFCDNAGNTFAGIYCNADANAGSGDYPGRLVFSTTADGESSPTERMRLSQNGRLNCQGVYDTVTAAPGNVVVDSNGLFYRSSSSAKYKTQIETTELQYSEALFGCRPVWYRSLSELDNPQWGWWGFIAEEVAQIDPRLVHWRTTEVVVAENGSIEHVDLEEPIAEGVQYDRFVPHLLNLIKRQKEQIEAMEARLTALESA